jgi:hypothetical protein
MTYKGIILSVLLAPFTIIGNNNVDIRIQELEEKFFQKELELSDLGKMIAEKDELLSSFDSDCQNYLRFFINKKIKQLEEKNDGKSLSEEEEKQLANELRKMVNEFLYTFCDACRNKKDIKDMLLEGLFYQDESTGIKEFESFKFYLIRSTFEREITIRLIKKYEHCIQELIVIKAELENLQKQ